MVRKQHLGGFEMTDPKTALQNLAARGITTLEQLAARKAQMRERQRIDSEKALEEILARSAAPPDPSYISTIGPPASSVAIVLDGDCLTYQCPGYWRQLPNRIYRGM
jgi:hypothetical protein